MDEIFDISIAFLSIYSSSSWIFRCLSYYSIWDSRINYSYDSFFIGFCYLFEDFIWLSCKAFKAYCSKALFLLTMRSLNRRKSSARRSWLNNFLYLDSNPFSIISASFYWLIPIYSIIPSTRVPTSSLNSWIKN